MNNIENVLSKLQRVKKVNGGFMASCPVPTHGKGKGDKTGSLSVRESDGKLLLFCHAGCAFADIIGALGLPKGAPEERVEVAHYNYTDEKGNLILQVVRFEPKGFSQRKPVDGGWEWNTKDVKAPLFHLPEIIKAKEKGSYILFVEGEKDCVTLQSLGITATSIRGGASGKWSYRYTSALEGAKVAIIPDNDEPGKKHSLRVAEELNGWVPSLRVLELPDQAPGEDVTDWLLKPGNDRLKLANILNNTAEFVPPKLVARDEFNSLKHMIIAQGKEIKSLRWKLYDLQSRAGKRKKDGE